MCISDKNVQIYKLNIFHNNINLLFENFSGVLGCFNGPCIFVKWRHIGITFIGSGGGGQI